MAGALAMALTMTVSAQNTLKFTSVNATPEKAIQLHWASVSNEVYEIDEADALIDTNTGSTTWNKLYDDYPSQGTNTFIGDFGNYNLTPQILCPQSSPFRLYRVMDLGPDTTSDEPLISIVSPTNGFVAFGDLTVTVSANTDQATLSTKLYVDGQEMPMSEDGSNYVINTCEWGNGAHTIYATAKCTSALEGPMGVGLQSVAVGHAVSPFVSVIFSNLVTKISFSQVFFNPDVGQTQQVSAVFANNSNWTLTIRDIYSNAVRTVTGSGSSMSFNWDGTGDGSTNISNGVYYYYISAQTNGLASQGLLQVNSSSSASAASLSASQPTELFAIPTNGSESVVPLALYPQGFDTNSLIIFRATQSEIDSLYPEDDESAAVAMDSGSILTPDASNGGSSASSQNASPSPQRPPTNPVKGIAGTFGIAYQRYLSTNATIVSPLNGFPVLPGQQAQHVKLDTNTVANVTLTMPTQPIHTEMANNFIEQMQKGGWIPSFIKVDDDLKASDLKGNGGIFNQVNLGLLICHGSYGTTIDYNANQTLDIYFSIESLANNNGSWVRLSDMSLGSSNSATNSLRWMAIFACNSLRQANYDSMNNGGQLPITSNLHLLLGTDSVCYPTDNIAALWARSILGLSFVYPQQIWEAWYTEARGVYGSGSYPGAIKFAVAGWADNFSDTVQSTGGTSGDLQYQSVQVYP